MRKALVLVALGFVTLLSASAGTDQPDQSELQTIIATQFGPQFVLLQQFPVLVGDFNGDGSEDAVFVANSRGGVQANSGRFHVSDPSSDYFGIGDPRITSQFASPMPGGARYLLIIHGSGKEGWHSKEPKERFVLINVAFERISLGRVTRKKKLLDDISVEESDGLNSFVFWNGHGYTWHPGAAQL
jgi:hypothetical protein